MNTFLPKLELFLFCVFSLVGGSELEKADLDQSELKSKCVSGLFVYVASPLSITFVKKDSHAVLKKQISQFLTVTFFINTK